MLEEVVTLFEATVLLFDERSATPLEVAPDVIISLEETVLEVEAVAIITVSELLPVVLILLEEMVLFVADVTKCTPMVELVPKFVTLFESIILWEPVAIPIVVALPVFVTLLLETLLYPLSGI